MIRCEECNIDIGFLGSPISLDGKRICQKCADKLIKEVQLFLADYKNILTTSTHNVDGFRVINYIEFYSVQLAFSISVYVDFSPGFQEYFQFASNILRKACIEKGGNAVVGTSLNFMPYSNNMLRMGFILSGTIVELTPE